MSDVPQPTPRTPPGGTHDDPGRTAFPEDIEAPGSTLQSTAPGLPSTPGEGRTPFPPLPAQFGRYRIVRLLGRGGMGSVYLAHDAQLDIDVALKVPHFGREDPEALERFHREARSAARLRHPHICPVFDVNESDGVHYLTMAYIKGEPLSACVRDYAARPPRDAAALVRTLALALEEAHGQGVIHRDLKPANVMIDLRGEPVVMDFGLARIVKKGDASETTPGTVMGTPAYMAPEQARGDVGAMGPCCDVYSLGVILYELLAGRVPFTGPTMEVLVQHARDEPPPLSALRPALDPHIEALCCKALAKEPSQRFLTMAEFAQALDAYLTGAPPERSLQPGAAVDPLESAAAAALVLLRTWGWEVGMARVREALAGPPGETEPRWARLVRWLEGDPDARAAGVKEFKGLQQFAALAGWALLAEAWLRNSEHNFDRAAALLAEAAAQGDPRDNVLQASIAHQRGFWLYHAGQLGEALATLHQALDLCGRDHPLTGEILDQLARVYANRSNFHAAREFFEQAILCKERFGGDIARTLRQLAHLYLDWGYPERAEEAAQKSLQLALRSQDEPGQANTFHYLGRVGLALGEREAAGGRKGAARRHLTKGAEWLDASIRANQARGRKVPEAFAHRDRALLCLAENNLEQAEAHARQAEALFGEAGHAEGLARVQQVRGILARRRGDFAEAGRLLRQALAHFDVIADYGEATRTQLETARTQSEGGAVPQLVTNAFLDALRRAEDCRRTDLVRLIEEELRTVDEEAHWQHVFHRVRGRAAVQDTSSLVEGASEVATALFLNLEGFLPFCQGLDAEEVMQTVNQMMADLGAVLHRHRAHVTVYLGGGFMALAREAGHAERAVQAALELIEVGEQLNRPRAVLGLRQLPVRIGIASGSMFLGNIGTYQKMDFTAVGAAVNLASRLMRQADNRAPCVSRETYELICERFEFTPDSPRVLDLPGIGRREVWDVTGRKKRSTDPGRSPAPASPP